MALDWANPWQYSPVAWGSGLMNGFNPWANAWGMGGDDATSDAGASKSAQPQQSGSNADGNGESAGFAGDATSGAYGMAKGAVGGLLGGLAKNAIATGAPAAALTGDAALGAGVGLASSFGPGFALGMGNMAAEGTGFAPSTTLGKGVTAAVQNPFGMGLLGGMFGPLGLALGAMAPFGAAAVEDAMGTRPADKTKDAMSDAFGWGKGTMAYNNTLDYAKSLEGPVASLALAETLDRDLNPDYSVSVAQSIGAQRSRQAEAARDAAIADASKRGWNTGMVPGLFDPMRNPYAPIAVDMDKARAESDAKYGRTYGGFDSIGGPSGGARASDPGYGPNMGGWGGLGIGNPATYGGGRSSAGGNGNGGGGGGASGGGHGNGDGCFLPGTLITMADGSKRPIEDVRDGDKVASFDMREGRISGGVVEQLGGKLEQKGYYKIVLSDGVTLRCTQDHPILTARGFVAVEPRSANDAVDMGGDWWLPVGVLRVGDVVRGEERAGQVVSITHIPDTVRTHNLEIVEPHHTFIADGKIVHNRT